MCFQFLFNKSTRKKEREEEEENGKKVFKAFEIYDNPFMDIVCNKKKEVHSSFQ